MGAPSIAVVTPTRDRPRYLRQMLESVDRQTVRPAEVIVVNDGGSPVTSPPSIRIPVTIINRHEGGNQAAALALAISHSRADLIALCDDDDLFDPDHLEGLLRRIGRRARFVYSDVRAFRGHPRRQIGVLRNEFSMDLLRKTNFIASCSVLFEHSLLEQAGGLDVTLPNYWDWDVYLRMARFTSIRRVPGAWAYHRIHPGSIQRVTPRRSLVKQLGRLCEKHGLGPLPFKVLIENFDCK